jgi:hypothetical protein
MRNKIFERTKKLAVMLLVSIFFPVAAWAGSINEQTAYQRAADFAGMHGLNTTLNQVQFQTDLRERAPKRGGADMPDLYVYNIGKEQGFIIVSGDDRTEPILGYSESGSFSETAIPDNMRAWLEGYSHEIESIPADYNNSAVSRSPMRSVSQTRSVIMPLIQTKWSQEYPYNYYTPIKCVTGCVATALAQAMNFYRWPQDETAIIPSYYSSSSVGRLAALDHVIFDWDNMLPNYDYNSDYDGEQVAAVAILMRYAGQAVQMVYGSKASSATTNKIAPALVNYFDYAKSARMLMRDNYSISDWDNMVYGELEAGRPVIYSGNVSEEGGGHVFLVDGYDGDGYYHVNWGWGGLSDGFFLLSVMNPNNGTGAGASSSRYGYDYKQEAMFGMMPSTKYSGGDLTSLDMYYFSWKGTKIEEKMVNTTGVTKEFEMGIGYYDAEGELQVIYSENMGALKTGIITSLPQKDIDGMLADGSYTIYAINRVVGAQQWSVFSNPRYAGIVTVSEGQTTIRSAYSNEDISMEVKGWELIGNRTQYGDHELKVTIKNNGPDYESELCLYGTYDDETYSLLGKHQVAIADDETAQVSFFFSPNQSGTLKLFVTKGSYGKDYTDNLLSNGENSYNIRIGGGSATVGDVTKLEATSITIDNMVVEGGNKCVYSKGTVTGKMTIRNNSTEAYSGDAVICAFITSHFEEEDPEDYDKVIISEEPQQIGRFSTGISLAAAEDTTVDFTLTVCIDPWEFWQDIYGDYPETLEHEIGLLMEQGYDPVSEQNYYTMNGSVKVYPDYGVEIRYADGTSTMVSYKRPIVVPETATSVDLCGFSGNGIILRTSSAQPNCLYLRYGYESDITGLPKKNVIKGTVADKIELTDGYDFVPPFEFTARHISYTRTTATGAGVNGGGWQTLVLPFAATRLTRGDTGTELDWFQSAEDVEKDLWIKDFIGVNDTSVLFGFAPATLEPYHPYIMAVPSDELDVDGDLRNVPLRFEGHNALILADSRSNVSTSGWKYTGTMSTTNENDVYVINESGTAFVRTDSATMQPFTAWLVSKQADIQVPVLKINASGSLDSVRDLYWESSKLNTYYYNLKGMRMLDDFDKLPKGLYIYQGKIISK